MVAVSVDTEFAEARRARAESAEFEWSTSPLGIICSNRTTQKTYVVTPNGCSCEDWRHRGSKLGLDCKHLTGLKLHLLNTGGVL